MPVLTETGEASVVSWTPPSDGAPPRFLVRGHDGTELELDEPQLRAGLHEAVCERAQAARRGGARLAGRAAVADEHASIKATQGGTGKHIDSDPHSAAVERPFQAQVVMRDQRPGDGSLVVVRSAPRRAAPRRHADLVHTAAGRSPAPGGKVSASW